MKVTINCNNSILLVVAILRHMSYLFMQDDDNNMKLIGDGVHGGGFFKFVAIEGITVSLGMNVCYPLIFQ